MIVRHTSQPGLHQSTDKNVNENINNRSITPLAKNNTIKPTTGNHDGESDQGRARVRAKANASTIIPTPMRTHRSGTGVGSHESFTNRIAAITVVGGAATHSPITANHNLRRRRSRAA